MPDKSETNLLAAPCIQPEAEDVTNSTMTTWHKRDWQQYYELARRPWQRHRPPRPVYPTGLNRVLPAQGFSLSELMMPVSTSIRPSGLDCPWMRAASERMVRM